MLLQVCLDQVLATFNILDPPKTSKTLRIRWNRKILKENECALFSLKSWKLYESVDAKHAINFKRPKGYSWQNQNIQLLGKKLVRLAVIINRWRQSAIKFRSPYVFTELDAAYSKWQKLRTTLTLQSFVRFTSFNFWLVGQSPLSVGAPPDHQGHHGPLVNPLLIYSFFNHPSTSL